MSKKMYKVLCPMEGRNGVKFWSRLGSGFTNKDESINLHLDLIPFGKTNCTIQLREITEEDLRRDSERRAQSSNGATAYGAGAYGGGAAPVTASEPAPF